MSELKGYTPEEKAESDAIDAKLRALNASVDAALLAAKFKSFMPAEFVPAEVRDAAGIVARALPLARAAVAHLPEEVRNLLDPVFAAAESIARIVED